MATIIVLPLVATARKPVERAEQTAQPHLQGHETILRVDDEDELRNAMAESSRAAAIRCCGPEMAKIDR